MKEIGSVCNKGSKELFKCVSKKSRMEIGKQIWKKVASKKAKMSAGKVASY